MSDKFTPEKIAEERKIIANLIRTREVGFAHVDLSEKRYPAALDEIERLQSDFADCMQQFDIQQKRACDAEARIQDLEGALKEIEPAVKSIANEFPVWHYEGKAQDPGGIHKAVETIDKALKGK